MARLVAVCRSQDHPFERRQIPLVVDDNLTMVIQFTDSCIGCESGGGIKQRELEPFVHKFNALTSDEVAVAMMAMSPEIFNLLAQMVPCVGCRRSVERLFNELVKSGHPALEPLIITPSNYLSLKREYLFDAKAIYALFYLHRTRLQSIIGNIPKSRKNKRCVLHSLDSHKTKALGSWTEIWDVLSQECREEVVLIDSDSLMETLDNYLRKHRFCSECKAKVLRAYQILVGELDKTTEKGYCPSLYDGLKCCTGEKHVHVLCETDFIGNLIGRAEPELSGSRRERHAKTLDIAQEEVLTCLGVYLYERLHKIWQKLRAEEQTWQILFCVGVDALKKNFEVEIEKKQGISNLELTCLEFLEEEQVREQRRVNKRQKKKRKKTTKLVKSENSEDLEKEGDDCKCDENTNIPTVKCASCDDHDLVPCNTCICACPKRCTCGARGKWHLKNNCGKSLTKEGLSNNMCDCGYSSGHDCENCSVPSSHNGSDIACSEGVCNHDGDGLLCHRNEAEESCRDCCSFSPTLSPKQKFSPKNIKKKHLRDACVDHGCNNGGRHGPMTLSLADMLHEPCCIFEEEGGDYISEEEIRSFKENQKSVTTKRQELREKLKQQFANMVHLGNNGKTATCSDVAQKLKDISVK